MEEKRYQSRDVSVSQRQIYILSLLSENPKGYEADEIQRRLKNWDIAVSRRTILRDIDELSLNYGIGEEERGGKTYYFADKYTLKNVDLTIEDLASIAFAKEMLKGYTHLDMGRHAIGFLDKIVEQSAALNKLQFENLCRHFGQAGKNAGNVDMVDSRTQKLIQNAIDNQNKIKMVYYSFSSDTYNERVIHPHRLLLVDGYLSVEGYCELRQEIRRFRLSRIKELEVSDAQFDQATEMREGQGQEDTFLKLAGKEKEALIFLFTGDSIRYVREYEARRAKRIEEKAEGLYFYGEAAVTPDVIRWVRGFGPEVQVLEPGWLAKKLEEEAEKICNRDC